MKLSVCPKHFLLWSKLVKPKSLANGGPHVHFSSQNNGPTCFCPYLCFSSHFSLSYPSSFIAARRLGGSLLFAGPAGHRLPCQPPPPLLAAVAFLLQRRPSAQLDKEDDGAGVHHRRQGRESATVREASEELIPSSPHVLIVV